MTDFDMPGGVRVSLAIHAPTEDLVNEVLESLRANLEGFQQPPVGPAHLTVLPGGRTDVQAT